MAAGRKEFELLFKLSASLGPAFSNAFSKAGATAGQLNQKLIGIQKQQRDVSAYTKQAAAIEANKNKLAALTNEHNRLQAEIQQTEQPTEALKNKLAKTEKQIASTTEKIRAQEASLNGLEAKLKDAGIDTGNLTKENQRLADSYEKVKKQQERLNDISALQDKNRGAIATTKTQLLTTVGAAAAVGAALYKGPVTAAMDLQSTMADVAKVVDGLRDPNTGEFTADYYAMRAELQKLSTEIPYTTKELGEIAAAAGQAGIARKEIAPFTADAAKMGVAFDVSAAQAGDWMAKWRTAFGLSQEGVKTLADKINYLGNTGAAAAPEISGVVTKIGALGEIAGFNNSEIAALAASLISVGVNEDVAATGIKKVMTTMTAGAAATKKQQKVLAQLGLDATGLADRMQTDAQGAVLDLLAALNKLPKAQQAAALKQYFGEESVAAIAPLLTQTDLLRDNFGKVADAAQYAGSMEAEYAARADTDANKVELAKNKIKVFSQTVGNVMLPMIGSAAEKIGAVVVKINEWATANPEMVKTILKVAGGLVALKVGSLGAKLGFLNLKGGVLAIAGAFAKFSASGGIVGLLKGFGGLGGKLLPIIGIAGAVAVAVKLISGNLEGVRAWIEKTFGAGGLAIFDKAVSIVQGLGGAIGNVFSSDNINKAREFISGAFGEGGLAIFDSLIGVFNQLRSVIPPIITQLSEIAKSIFPLIVNIGGQIVGFIGKLIETILPPVFNILSKLLPILGKIAETILPVISKILQTILPIISQIVGGALDLLAEILGKIISGIEIAIANLPNIIAGAKAVIASIGQWFTNLWERIKAPFISAAQWFDASVIQPIATVFAPIISKIGEIFTKVWEIITAVFGFAAQWFDANVIQPTIAFFAPIVTTVGGFFNNLWTRISAIFSSVTIWFSNKFAEAWNAIKTVFAPVGEFFTGVWNTIKEQFTKIGTAIGDAIGGAFKAVVNAIIQFAANKINGFINGINACIDIVNKIPGVGITKIAPLAIPLLAKGATRSPDTFIAGERGAELIAGAKGRKVFTALETNRIFNNMQVATEGAPIVRSDVARGGSYELKITSAPPIINVHGGDVEEVKRALAEHDDELLEKVKDFLYEKEDTERRRGY